jgi:hypothetical protein
VTLHWMMPTAFAAGPTADSQPAAADAVPVPAAVDVAAIWRILHGGGAPPQRQRESPSTAPTDALSSTTESATLAPLAWTPADEDSAAHGSIPAELRLLWPTPLYGFDSQLLRPAELKETLQHVERLHNKSDAAIAARDVGKQTSRRPALRKGYSSADNVFWPSQSQPSTTPHDGTQHPFCHSGTAALDTLCSRLRQSLQTVFEARSSLFQPHRQQKGGCRSEEVDVRFLTGSLHRDRHMDAHRPRSANMLDLMAKLLQQDRPPRKYAAAAEDANSFEAPFFFTVMYVLQREQGGGDSAHGLSIDDELSLSDPRSAAAPLSPRDFLASDQPLRLKLNTGMLLIWPSWLTRTLSPYVRDRRTNARVWTEWQISVRYRKDAQCLERIPLTRSEYPPISFFRWATPIYRHTNLFPSTSLMDETNLALASELMSMRERERQKNVGRVKSNRGGWHSHLQLLQDVAAMNGATSASSGAAPPSVFSRLRRLIVQHVHAYLRHVSSISCSPHFLHSTQADCRPFSYRPLESDLEKSIELTFSWAIMNDDAHFNMPHTHPQAMFSGVYYIATGASNTTNIHFRAPGPIGLLYPARGEDEDEEGMPRRWKEPFSTTAEQRAPGSDVVEQVQAGKLLLFPAWLEHYVVPHWSEPEVAKTRQGGGGEGMQGGKEETASGATSTCGAAASEAGATCSGPLQGEPHQAASSSTVLPARSTRICISFNVMIR